MAHIAQEVLTKLDAMEEFGALNPFYETLYRDMAHIMKTSSCKSMQRLFVVKQSGQITFEKPYVDKYYKTKPEVDTIAKTITKQLQLLFRTPNFKADFNYAKVEPWEYSKAAFCYQNVSRFCDVHPNYQPIYVYAIWDRGTYFELEPHALVKDVIANRIRDITPTVEVLLGKPSLSKVCYVYHPNLESVLCSANKWKIQYGFVVEKQKK